VEGAGCLRSIESQFRRVFSMVGTHSVDPTPARHRGELRIGLSAHDGAPNQYRLRSCESQARGRSCTPATHRVAVAMCADIGAYVPFQAPRTSSTAIVARSRADGSSRSIPARNGEPRTIPCAFMGRRARVRIARPDDLVASGATWSLFAMSDSRAAWTSLLARLSAGAVGRRERDRCGSRRCRRARRS
jgi:hypothetical protein